MEEHDVIDLRNVFRALKKNKLILIAIPLVAMLTSAIISFFVLTPVYQASTTMMVGKTYTGEGATVLQHSDLLIANQLVKTYSEIAKSRAVTEKVLEDENIGMTPNQFASSVNINPVRDTQLIEITVNHTDPAVAAYLANKTAAVFSVKVIEIMKMDNVQVVDSAVTPNSPVKPNKKLNIAIAGVLGFMIAVGVVFLREFLDQTLKNSDDVNRHLELPVLGAVPKM